MLDICFLAIGLDERMEHKQDATFTQHNPSVCKLDDETFLNL